MTVGKFAKGDDVKIEIEDKQFGASEWVWMLVESIDGRTAARLRPIG